MTVTACCRNLTYKLREYRSVIVVSILLLVVVSCATAGLYFKIQQEYGEWVTVLGIWIPSVLLVAIGIYLFVACIKESTRKSVANHTLAFESPEGPSQSSRVNQNSRIDLNVGYRPDIERVEISRTAERATERNSGIPRVYDDPNKTSRRRRNFRSLSSSDLAVYYHRSPSRAGSEKLGYSLRRKKYYTQSYPSTAMSSGSKQGAPRRQVLKRSASESRTHRYRKGELSAYGGSINGPEPYREHKYSASCDQKLSDYKLSRIKQSKALVGNVSSPEFYIEDENFAPDEEELRKLEFYSRSVEGLPRIRQPSVQIKNVNPEFYREGKYFTPHDQKLSGGEFPRTKQSKVQVGAVNSPELYREGKYFASYDQALSDGELPRIKQSRVQVGAVSSPEFYREGKYFTPHDQALSDGELPRFKHSSVRVGAVSSPEFYRESNYSAPDEKEMSDYEFYNKSAEGLARYKQPNSQVGNLKISRFYREGKYSAPEVHEVNDNQFCNRMIRTIPRTKQHSAEYFLGANRGFVERETDLLGFSEENNQHLNSYRRGTLNRPTENKNLSAKCMYFNRKPEMTGFNSHRIIHHPPVQRPMLDSRSPPRRPEEGTNV